jgi:hypothetical protein
LRVYKRITFVLHVCTKQYICITLYYMKISKTFRLSTEAVDILNQQSNATDYLEQLILAGKQYKSNTCITREDVIQLIKEYAPQPQSIQTPYSSAPDISKIPGITVGGDFVPKPPDPETGYPCCVKKSPCKHWMWDELGSVWTNTLTNKTREE